MLGTRGIWHDGWHAATAHPPAPSNWSHFEQDVWELYNLRGDLSENKELAAEHPEKLEELKRMWAAEAAKYNGLPLDDRSPMEILATTRPQLSKPRDRYVYYPGCADVPEQQRGRPATEPRTRPAPGACPADSVPAGSPAGEGASGRDYVWRDDRPASRRTAVVVKATAAPAVTASSTNPHV
ncbi:hypothetical protein SUDANB105_06864 [Streptomyces sp. enrichment culture]|uniref:hypothetical protein n=1 Tax=Streptomyces sp. enrichment culture TaxID=1795815 RepID=UPI003F55BC84